MAGNRIHDLPQDLHKLHGRFVRWRRSHTGRLPIPDSLWTAAAEVAWNRGINATAKVLHLEYGKLKEKTMAHKRGDGGKRSGTAASRRTRPQPEPPAFVEFFAPPNPGSSLECRVELEGRRGKMRIEFKGIATAELVALGRAFWDGEA